MKNRLFFTIVFIIASLLYMFVPFTQVGVRAGSLSAMPDTLTVVRSPTPSGATSDARQIITNTDEVTSLYKHVLSLPGFKSRMCPSYITEEYNLKFTLRSSDLLNASLTVGGCNTVHIDGSQVRLRSPDKAFITQIDSQSASSFGPQGLRPNDLQFAYNLDSNTNPHSETVAVVDAYDNPKAELDLAVYRAQFQLPPCTHATKCFQKVNQNGMSSRYPRTNQGWSGEISLDLDMVSATCPKCRILLIEANDESYQSLGTAVNTAVRLGAHIVSNSYGSPEDQQTAMSDAAYYNHPGVVILASSGDNGYGVQLPAAFNSVIAVGGTSLSRIQANTSRGWSETAWSGSGSGCSQYIKKPSWQKDTGCAERTVADVAAVADPNTGVAVYNSYESVGWERYGGTSAASPIIAGIFALAGNSRNFKMSDLYSHPELFLDTVDGSNGSCIPLYLCTAGQGYDGPTGLGSPNGSGAF